MNHTLRSESLSEFSQAFIKAKTEFSSVHKNRDGRFKYADLDAIMSMAEPILIKHGLFIFHSTIYDFESGKTLLHTTLMHTSDQWIKSISPIETPQDAREIQQEFGKAKSYQERYATKSILGLTISNDPMDNDGEHHSKPTQYKPIQTFSDNKITEKQISMLNFKASSTPAIKQLILKRFNIKNFSELKKKDVNTILEIFEKA